MYVMELHRVPSRSLGVADDGAVLAVQFGSVLKTMKANLDPELQRSSGRIVVYTGQRRRRCQR
jgi:hypothetical protein